MHSLVFPFIVRGGRPAVAAHCVRWKPLLQENDYNDDDDDHRAAADHHQTLEDII
jgi:hypothetical protein